MGFDQNAYVNQYKRDNYDRVTAMLPKGRKALLQEYAQQRDASVNAVIIAALEAYTGLDLSSKD